MRLVTTIVLFLAVTTAQAQNWPQWGRGPEHNNNTTAVGQHLQRVFNKINIDPFVEAEMTESGGDLLAHYQVPLVVGPYLYMMHKGGTFTDSDHWETQTWNLRGYIFRFGSYSQRFEMKSDWKPVPKGSVAWEPVFQPAVRDMVLLVPGAGGTLWVADRFLGTKIKRYNPFGTTVNPNIYLTGGITVDKNGNVYYNAMQLDPSDAWGNDVVNAWIVKITPNGKITKASYQTMVPGAPAATDLCRWQFSRNVDPIPWPPTVNAVPPSIPCGSQRNGVNLGVAVANDGTIYTVSRTHYNLRWGWLVALNPNLTTKWAQSLRDRFNDGCNITLPPNGDPGGCRVGTPNGIDPTDNTIGAGRVPDDSTSSPTIAPDGSVFYGTNGIPYAQGHLLHFSSGGTYLGAYPFGWDMTPAIDPHNGTYSVVMKDNHYDTGGYCNGPGPAGPLHTTLCPSDRNLSNPSNPEAYYISRLSPSLNIEARFKSTNTQSCERQPDDEITCTETNPEGFEFCVNAIAVDAHGVSYLNSEDGTVYAMDRLGNVIDSRFLQLALGSAYTPIAIGPDGKIYTMNAGDLYVMGNN